MNTKRKLQYIIKTIIIEFYMSSVKCHCQFYFYGKQLSPIKRRGKLNSKETFVMKGNVQRLRPGQIHNQDKSTQTSDIISESFCRRASVLYIFFRTTNGNKSWYCLHTCNYMDKGRKTTKAGKIIIVRNYFIKVECSN